MANHKTIEEMIGLLTTLAIAAVIGIIAGCGVSHCIRRSTFDRDVVVDRDTIVIRDTIRIAEPVANDSIVVKYIPERLPRLSDREDADSLAVDSVDVVIPIEQKRYEGPDYKAWVSGYHPQLDSLWVYPQQTTIKETIIARDTPRWGLSIGAGVAVTPHRIEPGIFLGLTYTFIAF